MDTAGTTTHVTAYTYNTGTSTTTAAMPLGRTWSYVFDSLGRVGSIVDPLNQTTSVNWTSDNQVQKVTEPPSAGTTFVQYTYNANGYLTGKDDELGNHTTVQFEDLPVDANDTGNHISRVIKIVQPQGNTTPSTTDYTTTLDYTDTTRDRVFHVTDALGNQVTNAYNTDGTLATQTLPSAGDGITRTTTFNTCDANGRRRR